MVKPWAVLAEMIETDGAAAMVTVAELSGSGPREVGARMILNGHGRIVGTVGGGRLEWQALAKARQMLEQNQKRPESIFYSLGPELGQCCGGAVTLIVEVFDGNDLPFVAKAVAKENLHIPFFVETHSTAEGVFRNLKNPAPDLDFVISLQDNIILSRFSCSKTHLWLYGAGHVGSALVQALAPLPFQITWIDSRHGQFQYGIDPTILCLNSADPVATLDQCPDGAFVIVMTHSHSLDFDLCEKALRSEKYDFVGVIGSKTKAARFRSRLKQIPLLPDQVEQLICPLGLATIRGKEPAMVAASITAQLLEIREKSAISQPGISLNNWLQEKTANG